MSETIRNFYPFDSLPENGSAGKFSGWQSSLLNSSANGHQVIERARVSDVPRLKFVMLDPSGGAPINRNADVYRSLGQELAILGHEVLILKQAAGRVAVRRGRSRKPRSPGSLGDAYADLDGLKSGFGDSIRGADVIVVGSGLTEGKTISDWVTRFTQGVAVFYDLSTPATLFSVEDGTCAYLSAELIPRFPLYLSVTGGRILEDLQSNFDSPMARPFYHSVNTEVFYPERRTAKWEMGYIGDYHEERQPAVDELLLEPARRWSKGRFAVAGPNYPRAAGWPANVTRLSLLESTKRREFYNSQKFALATASPEAAEGGYSPGRRLLEAAACGVPVISDYWEGIETFFEPLEQILISRCAEESLSYLVELGPEERKRIGTRARNRVLAAHSCRQRALELQNYVLELVQPSVSGVSG